MCKPCATHSDRQILCNPAKDSLSCWIMDLKSWSEIWIGRSNVILAEDSPLPLPCFVASQFAWTHPCPQESPACSRGQRKINRQFGYSSSDAEHVAGRNMIAIRWIPPGDRKSTDKVVWFVLCVFGFFFYSRTSSSLHEFLKWLFPPYLWESTLTSGNFPQAGEQWNKRMRDMETSHESQEGKRASSSRPLQPQLGTQSLISGLAFFLLAVGRFCCPYSPNSISEIYGTLCRVQTFL